jgi:putative (di)nucleoside polyphosphate hydrolase
MNKDRRSKGMKRPAEYFRAGAGAVIINGSGLVLALERAGLAGAWQFPQGGLKGGEEPLEAAYREIDEETGIAAGELELLATASELLAYELPPEARSEKTGRGQVQYWFLFRFLGEERSINVEQGEEFQAWQWLSFSEILKLTVGFRRPVYRRLGELFGRHLIGKNDPS